MKEIIIVLLTIFIFTSCQKDDEFIKDYDAAQRIHSHNYDEFITDSRHADIYTYVEELLNFEFETNQVLVSDKIQQIENLCCSLNDDYGKDQITILLNEATKSLKDGDCCKKTEDGRVDWSCCNFFEVIAVVFANLGCPSGNTSDQAQISEMYDCFQANICEIC